jgi:dolichol-phosphate mannosyltransferase
MPENELVSVVVPVHDEQDNILPLHAMLSNEFARQWCDFEIVFVDDGSRDQTVPLIRGLAVRDSRVRLVSLSRNFGTQLAIFAGLEHASGQAVIVMDGDLQHPPSLIHEMIGHWKEGFDVVYAVREETEGAPLFRRLASWAFLRLFRTLVNGNADPRGCNFRLMDRRVVDQLLRMRERDRFFRSLVAWVGFRQTGIPYKAARRHAGTSKHDYRRLVSLALDAITSFSTVPLRLCTYAGFLIAAGSIPYIFWAIYVRLFTDTYVPGWAAIVVAVLILGAVQLISLGILGEYVGRIYEEVKGRPLYVIRETIGLSARGAENSGPSSPAVHGPQPAVCDAPFPVERGAPPGSEDNHPKRSAWIASSNDAEVS